MFFKKRKVVDIRDLPRRQINFDQKKDVVPSDSRGFVDLTKKQLPLRALQTKQEVSLSSQNQPGSAFNFFDTTPTRSIEENNSENSSELKSLIRKVSMQISELDSQIYKIEQRLEVVERKTGVGGSTNSDSGSSLIGW